MSREIVTPIRWQRTQYETEGFYQLLTLYMIQCRDD